MTTVNSKPSHFKNKNSLVDDIVSWISGILKSARSHTKEVEEINPSSNHHEDYETQLLRKATKKRIEQLEFINKTRR